MKWPWKISLVLLIIGLIVVLFSLQSLQSKAVAQELAMSDRPEHKDYLLEHMFDTKMPGSLSYQVERSAEKLRLMFESGENRTDEQLARAKHRLTASQYAWQHDHTSEAIQTLNKAFIYLSHTTESANHFTQKTELADEMAQTMDEWIQSDASESEKCLLNELSAQLQAVRQHYHF